MTFTNRPGGYTMWSGEHPVAVVVKVGDLWYARVPGFGTTVGMPSRKALAGEVSVSFQLPSDTVSGV